jgi:hypothetical protein
MAEKLDPQTIDALDKLFNAWLALNGIISKGGALYKADPKGQILLNPQGQSMKADPQQFKTLINDPTHGFQAFVAKKGIHIKTVQRDFPDKK